MSRPAEPDGVLGLGPAEQAAYELVMAHPAATLTALAGSWRRAEALVEVLAALEERALVVSTADRYRAAAPAVAFDALLADFEERLEQARRHVATLDAAYQARPTTR